MAKRSERVAKNLQRIIAQIIDEELEPPALISVMNVTCDSGLTQARVAVSIYSKSGDAESMIEYLRDHVGLIRRELSVRAKMRRTPKILFTLDSSLENGQNMISYISNLSDRR